MTSGALPERLQRGVPVAPGGQARRRRQRARRHAARARLARAVVQDVLYPQTVVPYSAPAAIHYSILARVSDPPL